MAGGLFYDEFSQLTTLGQQVGFLGGVGLMFGSVIILLASFTAPTVDEGGLQEKFSGLTEETFKKFASFRYISVGASHKPGYHMACFKLTASVFKRQPWGVRQMKKVQKKWDEAMQVKEEYGLLLMLPVLMMKYAQQTMSMLPDLWTFLKKQVYSLAMKLPSTFFGKVVNFVCWPIIIALLGHELIDEMCAYHLVQMAAGKMCKA